MNKFLSNLAYLPPQKSALFWEKNGALDGVNFGLKLRKNRGGL
jgi:hypothetical protein